MKMDIKSKNFKAVIIRAREGRKILGQAFLYIILNEQHKKVYGILGDVFVNEESRGKGLGTKLVKQAVLEAKKRKCYKLLATSRFENKKLHKWYQGFGFKKYGVEFRVNF